MFTSLVLGFISLKLPVASSYVRFRDFPFPSSNTREQVERYSINLVAHGRSIGEGTPEGMANEFENLLGPTLHGPDLKTVPTSEALRGKKHVMLYFSAHW
jgi:hypothetical protein